LWDPVLDCSSWVMVGQTESYSPIWPRIEDWYSDVIEHLHVTHFRPHPAGNNPTRLPEKCDMNDAGFHALNSSFACEVAFKGKPLVVHDEGCMAWGINTEFEGVQAWAEWLAWTQWHHDEIRAGEPIAHLFEDIA
jgi:hypothetical protein